MSGGASSAAYRSIVVPTDFSETAQRALEFARGLAMLTGGELILVHAYFVPMELQGILMAGPQKVSEMLHLEATERLDALASEISEGGPKVTWLAVDGVAEEVIVRCARERSADLIVMGTHGRTGFSHALLGSRAERVLRTAECPVVTVPPLRNAPGDDSKRRTANE